MEHASYKRLRKVMQALSIQLTDAELARKFNVLDQHVNNWKKRGVPNHILIELCDEWNFRLKYVKDGEGEMFAENYSLTNELKQHLKVLQNLPEYARTEVIRDAIKTAELITKATTEAKGNGTKHQ
jgi:CI repressor-like protein